MTKVLHPHHDLLAEPDLVAVESSDLRFERLAVALQAAGFGFGADGSITSTEHVEAQLHVRLFARAEQFAQPGHFGTEFGDLSPRLRPRLHRGLIDRGLLRRGCHSAQVSAVHSRDSVARPPHAACPSDTRDIVLSMERDDQAETDDIATLRADNAELRRRVEAAEAVIDTLRAEALQRRGEVRSLAEALPTALSRHALVTGMLRDVRHHPDKSGAMKRAVRKLGRAPRKAVRIILRKG